MNVPARLIGVVALLFASTAAAQINPPVVRGVSPRGASAGETIKVTIEGTNLDRASAIVFDGPIGAVIHKATATSVDATLTLPADLLVKPLAFRVVSPRGISGVVQFGISRPGSRVAEVEPNDGFRIPQAVKPPCTVEGSIRNGMDVDIFAVDLRAGETIVADVSAARIGSTLDPLVTIFASDGRELASDDDLFGLDAAASVKVPRDGRYFIQVIEANGRSQDGMIEAKRQANRFYRLTIGTVPLLVAIDPPGARRGERTKARLLGAGLPAEAVIDLASETPLGDHSFRVGGSNAITIRVGERPEIREVEPDDRPDRAIEVAIPATINGAFDRKDGGDLDYYRIKPANGKAADFAITAFSARIGSPADPVLSLLGDEAQSLVEDDDKLGRDARIERRIEPNGLLLGVREFYGRGGNRFLYRIEIEPLAPIVVKVDLGSRTIPRRGRIALPIALERHGYDGPVTVLAGPLPDGVTSTPVTIPAGATRGMILIAASDNAELKSFSLRLVSRDVPGQVDWSYSDPDVWTEPTFAIAETATLDVMLEPRELLVDPGGQAEIKVRLVRSAEGGKSAVKVSFAMDGGGLGEIKEETLAAGVNDRVIPIKLKPDAAPGRFHIVARARFDGSTEGQSVVAAPVVVQVKTKAK